MNKYFNIDYYSPFYSKDENICSSSIMKINSVPSSEISFVIFILQTRNLFGENP